MNKVKYTDEELLNTLKILNIQTNEKDILSARGIIIHKMAELVYKRKVDVFSNKLAGCLYEIINKIDDELHITGDRNIQFDDIFYVKEYEYSDDLEHFLGDFYIKGVIPVG